MKIYKMEKKMSFECGVGDCNCSYTGKEALRRHQRKKHASEYAQHSLMIRQTKKARAESPDADGGPRASFVIQAPINEHPVKVLEAASPSSVQHELCQVALANTRLYYDEQISGVKKDVSDLHGALAAQISDLNQRMKQLAKKTNKWCVVCYERDNDFAFLPCGHKCMCERCSINTMKIQKTCPYCRTPISRITRIYDVSALP